MPGMYSQLSYGCCMKDDPQMPGSGGRWRFIGEPIKVETEGEIPEPSSFTWKDRQYRIKQILVSWFDWNFPAGAKRRDWKSRRHRRYYRVNTEDDQIFEIYRDRKNPEHAADWICYQQWVPETGKPETDSM